LTVDSGQLIVILQDLVALRK